jgi:hypothetical protein
MERSAIRERPPRISQALHAGYKLADGRTDPQVCTSQLSHPLPFIGRLDQRLQARTVAVLSVSVAHAKEQSMDKTVDARSLEELKELGAGRRAPGEIARLYDQAFRDYGAQALWNRRPSEMPTITQALVVAENLRREGNLQSRALAGEIERACRAAL